VVRDSPRRQSRSLATAATHDGDSRRRQLRVCNGSTRRHMEPCCNSRSRGLRVESGCRVRGFRCAGFRGPDARARPRCQRHGDRQGSVPIAKAQVTIVGFLVRTPGGGSETSGVGSAETGPDGRYVCEPVPLRDISVHAGKRGYFSSDAGALQISSHAREQQIDLQLEPGRIVGGRLVDMGGAPARLATRSFHDLCVLGLGTDPLETKGRPHSHAQNGTIDWEGGRLRVRTDRARHLVRRRLHRRHPARECSDPRRG
jgi:hypothetical protein